MRSLSDYRKENGGEKYYHQLGRKNVLRHVLTVKNAKKKKLWSPIGAGLLGHSGLGRPRPVILPPLKAGGGRCSVKPASRSLLRSKSVPNSKLSLESDHSAPDLEWAGQKIAHPNPAQIDRPTVPSTRSLHLDYKPALPSSTYNKVRFRELIVCDGWCFISAFWIVDSFEQNLDCVVLVAKKFLSLSTVL
ncbi:Uncharacterized protein Rs2_52621 [Raphanus sativus]|nr:Uncharacterized protein Rs2_52621 [Raphanus sativus]